MDIIAIVGLAVLILVKEAGVPLPVPGDLVIIGAGATLTGDLRGAGIVLAIILISGFIGSSIQFFVFRSALRGPLIAALGRLGIGQDRIDGLASRFQSGGTRSVALARMTPGLRVAAIPAAAIAVLPYMVFLPGLVAGNSVFVTAHFGLGFVVGAYASDLFERFGVIAVIVVILVVLAVAGWLVLRSRRRAAAQTDAYECWADCTCPACIALLSRAGAGT